MESDSDDLSHSVEHGVNGTSSGDVLKYLRGARSNGSSKSGSSKPSKEDIAVVPADVRRIAFLVTFRVL